MVNSQIHEYLFNNNLNEKNGGPALIQKLACGAAAGSYGIVTASTSAGQCLLSDAYCFNDGGGLQYTNPGIITGTYTINVFFKFSSLGGYARVIDFSNSASDAGLYFLGNCINFYPNGNVGPCPYFNTSTFYLITFVRNGSTGIITVYVDGVFFGSYTDSANLYSSATSSTPINFFLDDMLVPCENQAGCVKYISVSPTAISASDVALLYANIDNITQSSIIPPPIVTMPTLNTLNCINPTLTLTATGNSGTIIWNGGVLFNAINGSTISAPNTYIATITDNNGCIGKDTIIVTSNTNTPVVTTSSSGIFSCTVNAVIITGTSAGNNMVWNGGALVNATNPATVYSPGTYIITVTDPINGCINAASLTVTADTSAPLLVTVNSDTICTGQTATLIASGANTYTWSTGEITDSINVSPLSTTSYTVTGVSGQCSGTAIATVTIIPILVAVNSDTICTGQMANLIASGANAYTWSTGEITGSINVSPLSTTSYTVTGVSGQCSDAAIATVTIIPILVAVNSDTICPGQPATLIASGANTYTWSTGEITGSINVSPLSTTSYTVTGVSGECSDAAIATITIIPILVAVNSDTICTGQTASLIASGANAYTWSTGEFTSSINVSPLSTTSYTVTGVSGECSDAAIATLTIIQGITVDSVLTCLGVPAIITASGATSYLWSTGETTASILISGTSSTYTVIGTTSSCADTAVSLVTASPPPNVSFSADIASGCNPFTVNFLADTTNNAGATYSWDFGQGFSWSEIYTSHTYSVAGCHTVALTVSFGQGCTSTDSISCMINVFPQPEANFNILPDEIDLLFPTAYFSNISTNATSWLWDFGDGTNSILQHPEHTFADTGTYNITLISSTINNCIDSITYTIEVKDITTIYIPNAFSPNKNGKNEIFNIYSFGISPDNFELLIFDRWGKQIFKTNDLNLGWNGSFNNNGEVLENSVYSYHLNYNKLNGKHLSKIGYITLVK